MATQPLTATFSIAPLEEMLRTMAEQPFMATFSTATLEALSRIATQDEIDTLQAVLDLMTRGRGKPWQVQYVMEIIERLAEGNQHESAS